MQTVVTSCKLQHLFMTTITLRTVPDDLIQHLLKEQFANKMEKKIGQYSLEKTVIKIIREHKESKR